MTWICGQPPLTILSIGSVTIHSAFGLELGGELLDGAREAGVLEGAALDLADGVHDGGVISAGGGEGGTLEGGGGGGAGGGNGGVGGRCGGGRFGGGAGG